MQQHYIDLTVPQLHTSPSHDFSDVAPTHGSAVVLSRTGINLNSTRHSRTTAETTSLPFFTLADATFNPVQNPIVGSNLSSLISLTGTSSESNSSSSLISSQSNETWALKSSISTRGRKVKLPDPQHPNVLILHPPFPEHFDYLYITDASKSPALFLDPNDFIVNRPLTAAEERGPDATGVALPQRFAPPAKSSWEQNLANTPGLFRLDDGGNIVWRCLFCEKSYSSAHSKQICRRHMLEDHNIDVPNHRCRKTERGEFYFVLLVFL
jgi:hypothetical protein